MKITIICVGKIKEKFYTEAVREYSKRLSRYCTLSITEVADEKTKEQASETEIAMVKDREGERILKSIRPDGYVIALAIDGKQHFSRDMKNWFLRDLMCIPLQESAIWQKMRLNFWKIKPPLPQQGVLICPCSYKASAITLPV